MCSALQILNHLQDCQADWRDLQRLYIPSDWLREAGPSNWHYGIPLTKLS